MSEYAISVNNVSKMYKLYDKPMDRLKESLGFSREKKYHEHYALNDVSFTIKKGETLGIIGTNGAGKSTILKIITGVLSQTDGEVLVNGRISALLELGAGFNMEYSGLENVYLNGTMLGYSHEEIDGKLEAILAFADIGEFINQPVKTYSSGMFVRLAFAVAINIDPDILIVDEALSVGDVFFQAKCYRKFEEFKKMGRTLLFVSHDLGSVNKYCDRAILLNKGEKLAEGIPKEMIDLYKKVLVNQEGETQSEYIKEKETKAKDVKEIKAKKLKKPFLLNPNVSEYGTKAVEIKDFTLLDSDKIATNTIEKFTEFSIKIQAQFNETVQEVIYAYTIKDLKGTDLTGTNTMYEKVDIEPLAAGETQEITFKQRMNLQGGEYLLSLGCTGYRNGEFEVHHRLYDICNISVVSTQDTVGYFDMDSDITVENC